MVVTTESTDDMHTEKEQPGDFGGTIGLATYNGCGGKGEVENIPNEGEKKLKKCRHQTGADRRQFPPYKGTRIFFSFLKDLFYYLYVGA